jgi:hypothetical protein
MLHILDGTRSFTRERCRAIPHLAHARRCGSVMAMAQELRRRRIERGSRGQQRERKNLLHAPAHLGDCLGRIFGPVAKLWYKNAPRKLKIDLFIFYRKSEKIR